MRQSCVLGIAVSMLVVAAPASAAILRGGGNITTDCVMVFDVPGANKPAPPKTPKMVDCIDGDPTCDEDGLRNGQCVFDIRACINSSDYLECSPDSADSSVVDHAIDDGEDSRFDNDWLALQDRINGFGLPSFSNSCSLFSAVTVRLAGPDSNNLMKKARKSLRVTTEGVTVDGSVTDVDKIKFMCRPEGDRVYLPTDLFSGTFDRIQKQIFTPTCALSTCHDSESHENDLILLEGSAYGNIVNVAPYNPAAALDGLMRVTPGDPAMSYLYRKITAHTDALPFGYGDPMPLDDDALDAELLDLVEKWILGDGVLGPAPATGWVEGTDQ